MKKIYKKDIPDALIKWADDTDDLWIVRYIRSLGYSIDDLIKLALHNKKISHALVIVSDSLYEKAAYKAAEGYLKHDLALSIYEKFSKRLKPLAEKEILIDFSLKPFS